MMYLVLSQPSTAYAESISKELWAISRPSGNGATKLYTSWIASDKGVAIYVPNDTQPVHIHADLDGILSLLSPVVTIDELNTIEAVIDGRRGMRINFLDVLKTSPSLSPNLRTREQLESAGWFPTDEI